MSTARRPGLGTVLAKPAHRHLFAAQTISRWGDTFNTVAWSCSCSVSPGPAWA